MKRLRASARARESESGGDVTEGTERNRQRKVLEKVS